MDFVFSSKEKLLAALEARRPWAEQLDVRQAIEHKKAEARALERYRKSVRDTRKEYLEFCKKALEADYATVKRETAYGGKLDREPRIRRPDIPACPRSTVQMLDQAIAQVKADGRKTYRLTAKGHFCRIHYLLSYDETAKQDVCT